MDTVEAGRVVPCHWAHARQGPRGHLFCGSRAGRDAAAPWTRARLALRMPEREELAHGLARGKSLRQMGHRLGRAPSTVSREVRRHGGRTRYRAAVADTRRGPVPVGRSRAGSRARWPCARWWRRHPRSTGHRSRSRGGSDRPSPPIRSCTCRTRRSTRSLFVQSRGVLKLAATVASTGCTRHGQWTACCGGGPVSSRVTGRDGEGRIRLLTPDAREARVR